MIAHPLNHEIPPLTSDQKAALQRLQAKRATQRSLYLFNHPTTPRLQKLRATINPLYQPQNPSH